MILVPSSSPEQLRQKGSRKLSGEASHADNSGDKASSQKPPSQKAASQRASSEKRLAAKASSEKASQQAAQQAEELNTDMLTQPAAGVEALLRPWSDHKGALNEPFWTSITQRVMSVIMRNPGQPLSSLQTHAHSNSPSFCLGNYLYFLPSLACHAIEAHHVKAHILNCTFSTPRFHLNVWHSTDAAPKAEQLSATLHVQNHHVDAQQAFLTSQLSTL